MSLGLYLHIPYCFSKCRYCDFYSHPGERGVPDAYVEALVRELDRFAPERPLQPDTLYFGGGTPSLLRPEQAKRLIDAARPLPGAEITLEANPETVTEQSLAGFREAGVNRISFGVQSARDTQLRTLGRPHTAKQARAAFAAARRAGTTASLDALGKYFGISDMVTVGSTYWNMVHGHCPEDVMLDGEGLQTMRNLGRSMAWLLHCIQAGREAGYDFPAPERGHQTNFIR